MMRGISFRDHYRNFPEQFIVDMLILKGWAHEADLSLAEAATREALEGWIDIGLGVRHSDQGRMFDPVEVTNFLKWAGVNERDAFWADRYVTTERRLTDDLASLGESETYKVVFRRSFHIREGAERARLRMPLPLASPHLVDLVISPFAEAAGDISLHVSAGRLEARVSALRPGDLTFGAELSFKALRRPEGTTEQLSEKEFELYLRPNEGLIVVTERIKALARSLAERARTSEEALHSFWDFILDEFLIGLIHYDQIDVRQPCDWALEAGLCDCQLASALFVALCRANNIPARLTGGYMLYRPAPANHYWAEAWIDDRGWTPVDFLSWDLSRGGRDAQWRDRCFGRLDPRMTTQAMPLAFTGALGIPMPADFIVVPTARPGGFQIPLFGADGNAVYSDLIEFKT
ncbi:transglutaminase-like domain-containing protein [Labrys okinawensis]|uniref:transglutaminase-like domain-containing protein n=1 Tax=Labrys okinawensis TaxID=346911 RepID=UPI0039BCD29F